MIDGVNASQSGAASGASHELAVSGLKQALDNQEQQGEAVRTLLESAVSTPSDAPGQQIDVTA